MTTAIRTPAEIFADAYGMHADALKCLAAGDIRDAADKAWCATLRSTDALILAWTGEEPLRSPGTSRALKSLGRQDARVRALAPRYYQHQSVLHGECFYLGLCEPVEETEQLIRETIDYVRDAENLATGPRPPGLRPATAT